MHDWVHSKGSDRPLCTTCIRVAYHARAKAREAKEEKDGAFAKDTRGFRSVPCSSYTSNLPFCPCVHGDACNDQDDHDHGDSYALLPMAHLVALVDSPAQVCTGCNQPTKCVKILHGWAGNAGITRRCTNRACSNRADSVLVLQPPITAEQGPSALAAEAGAGGGVALSNNVRMPHDGRAFAPAAPVNIAAQVNAGRVRVELVVNPVLVSTSKPNTN